jgi:hypothetical protein
MFSHPFQVSLAVSHRRFAGVALVVIVAFGLVVPPAVYGYVLQGPHVLELVVAKLSGPKTLLVEQEVTIDEPDLAAHPVTLRETVAYAFPDRYRSEAQYEQSHRIFVTSRGEHLSVIDGKWQMGQPNRFDRYKDLLLFHSRSMMHEALLKYGVDVGVTSLGRFQGRIVYVIGTRYPDESVSQVWVDKELFLPLRWLNVDAVDPALDMEFIYANWRKIQWRKSRVIWYPTRIETYYQQRLIRTIVIDRIQVDNALSPQLWDLAHLQSIYAPDQSPVEDEQPANQVDVVQQAIESFQKKFEP